MLNFLSSNYPIFKPDQILRSSDLNKLRAYLELQDRATRATLIGAGILCGLEASCDVQTGIVTVSKGVGVSSDGFLFLFENDRRFRLSAEIKLRKGELTGVFESVVGGSAEPEGPEVSAFEFSPGKPTDKIDCEKLTGFVFLLACKQVETAGKKCFNGFDNAGSVGELETRLLAVSAADYATLGLFKEDSGSGAASLLTQFPCIGRMPVCPPEGPNFPVYQYGNLKNDWLTNINTALSGIRLALAEAVDAAEADAWTGKMFALLGAFSAQNLPTVAPLQYLHSHLRDVICAYDELAIARSRASFTYCYGDLNFAKYVTLGPDCRMAWHRAGSDSTADADGQFAFLKNRLRRLLTDPLDFGKTSIQANKQPVRISGSAAKSDSLERQAIPYFYEESLRNDWNSALSAVNRQAIVQQYELNQNGAFPRNALSKELSKYDFFRVEGHLGLDLKTGFQSIEKLRADLNLPFELTCVRLGQQFLPANLPGELGHVTDQLVFDSFCRDHPGLDHLGGVPKGGTLVLIFVDEIAGNLLFDFQLDPNNPFHLFFLQNFGSRRIVADFCLPYSCFKAPMVEYKFEEICPPLADFEIFGQSWHAAFETFFEDENIESSVFAKKLLDMPAEKRPPVAKLILNDRSGDAILKKWFIQNEQIKTGHELGDAGFVVLKSTGEQNLVGYFRLDKLPEITVARSVELPPFPENRAEQQIDLCPHEMDLAIFDSEDKQDFGQEILLTNQVNAGAEWHLHFSPPGGQWADNSPSNPKLFELSFVANGIQSLVIKMPTDAWKPGSYFIRYSYPKGCGLEREVRLILPPPPQVQIAAPPVNVVVVDGGGAAVAARTEVPRAVINSRRAGYEKAIREDIPTAALRATPVFKNAESLLSIPFLPEKIGESLAAWKKVADAALKSVGKNGGADDDSFRLLTQNATWFLLDKLVVLHPDGLPDGVEKAFSSMAAAMKKAGIDLQLFGKNWNAGELRNPLTERYLALFD